MADEKALEAYERFLEEAQGEPVKFIKHDNRAHDDEALYRLTHKKGMSYYGWYWLLVELLAARKHHYYDLSDDDGWERLRHDMSCMCPMKMDECCQFVADLHAYGLINVEQYDELHRLTIRRLQKDSLTYAEEVARKKLGAWRTNQKKVMG